jgi:hypothetical protein
MDLYHVFCDLRPGVRDMDFVEALTQWMGHLRDDGLIEGWRVTRAKLGFGVPGFGDWHLMIELRDLTQLDAAFRRAAAREGAAEILHGCVNQLVTNARFALYRDFPDAFRVQGGERF